MYAVKPIILISAFCLTIISTEGQVKPAPKIEKDTAISKVDTLKAAIVTAAIRPHLKGDTIEYNTERMLMGPNTVVEELLRRLPGLQVDADGNLTFNGERIEHLLVDGEDIFGSSPTLVTRNFDASKIARVQILDRKSDDALFTGIDDGKRIKTLNLVLKDDAKNGYFGKVEAAGNTDGYYLADGLLAEFKKKEQFTALALTANTGTTNFGSAGNGNIFYLNGNADALGASAGTGIPRFDAVASHYANRWPEARQHLSLNYQYSHYFTRPVTVTQTVQIQPDSIYGQLQQSQSINQQEQQYISGLYSCAPGSRFAFEFAFYGSNSASTNQLGSTGSSTFNDTLVNDDRRTIQDKVSVQYYGASIKWRAGIGKQSGRVLAITFSVDKKDAITDGYLYSLDRFYQPDGNIITVDTVNQRKRISDGILTTNGGIGYLEPLWKGSALGLSYGLYAISDDPLQATYSGGDGSYQNMVDTLSSHLDELTVNQHASVSLNGAAGKLKYMIGNDWVSYHYHQRDLLVDTLTEIHYFNLAPTGVLYYMVDQSTNFMLNYNGSDQEPTITQLAPVVNNSDPLHINKGNPDLKPAYNQTLQLEFHRFRTWMINLALTTVFINNAISTRTVTDSLGRQINQPVNVNGGNSAGVNLGLGRKIWNIDMNLSANGTYSRNMSYVNADLSRNLAYTAGWGIGLNKFVADKYSLQFTTNFTYLDQVSSINPAAPIHYWTESHHGSLTVYLFPHFEINTNATYTGQEKISAFSANTSVLIWNGYVGRNFLHNKMVVKFQFNNILNQNAGITRTGGSNVNTQTSTNILRRYWMLSVAYRFDKKFKQK